ncbi:MAG: hypothetical protein JWM32_388 [Verrucomicrobia bacterium]|nr:hypothetical protein [Verrucomicrobiota bacterium]
MLRVFANLIQRARGLPWFASAMLAALGARTAVAAVPLNVGDLNSIYIHAADRASEIVPAAVIAIVDRDGRALLVRRANGSNTVSASERAIAVAKAGTSIFLSSNGEAFTSRTAGFIIQQNFPPGVFNRSPGPLVGVGFSNLAYSDINYFRELNGDRIPGSRLYGSPGGVPLYKDGVVVAAIGVTGDGTEQEDATISGSDKDEAIALAGQKGFEPSGEIVATNVYIDGISLPYVASEAKAATHSAGVAFDPAGVDAPAPATWPTAVIGGVPGQIRAVIRSDPLTDPIDGQARLTEAEVRTILANAAARTLVTRGGIRLPRGQPAAVFITVVNNPAQAGVAPVVLGTFRTPDATLFSWDVAIQKARTAVFFSSKTRAFSTRTVGFLAQTMYPPGLANQPAGPFNGLQERFSLPLLSGTAGSNPNLPNGMTIFPGGFPLYRNGVLIGAVGVSGDGVDQDDLIAASGTVGFQPSPGIRADNTSYLGARLPYAKFPRDAELRPGVDPVTSVPAGFQGLNDTGALLTTLSSLSGGDVSSAPSFLAQPVSEATNVGSSATFSVTVTGNPAPTIQWKKDGVNIAGATSPTLTVANVQAGDGGMYTAVAANSAGSNMSSAAALTVTATAVPVITLQPQGHAIAAGSSVIFGAEASGGGLSYQWQKNGAVLDGATSAQLLVSNAQASDAGNYSLTATNISGTVTSSAATLSVVGAGDPGRLLNASVRIISGADANVLIVGFALGGNGTSGTKSLLVRGIGPTLVGFGVPSAMVDPTLQIIPQGSTVPIESNDNWGGSPAISATSAATGAFSLPDANSKDSALVTSLSGGAFSAKVAGLANSTGTVLAEIYDAAPGPFNASAPRLINISARVPSSNDNPLIAGFVIGGSTAKTVMIRAIGPYLSQFFGAAAMADPKLELYMRQSGSDNLLVANDNWGGSPLVTSTAASVGAFALPDPESKDAVLLATLDPGIYSVKVLGVNNASGIILVEIYEVP